MTALRPVIDVREIPPLHSQLRRALPSLRSLVSPDPSPCEELATGYLRQGIVCGLCFDKGLLYDVLQPGKAIESPANDYSLLTNGIWIWPAVLPYYVKEYHLLLPADFLNHCQQQGWEIDPAKVDTSVLNTDWLAFDAVPEANRFERASARDGLDVEEILPVPRSSG